MTVKTKTPKLTPKQERFVKAIIKGKDQTEAAIEAGYSIHHAGKEGHQTISKDYVRKEIERNRSKINQLFEVTFLDKLNALWEIVSSTKYSDKEKETAINAIKEMNRMQGHLAPEKSVNLNINDSDMLKDIESIRDAYKKEY